MRSIVRFAPSGLVLAALATALQAGDSCTSCTGGGCEPRCHATWHEEKKTEPVYEMRCEFACARARDFWHAPDPECRCRPPCGRVYVKKRLYKSDGEERVERVPKYEVEMVPTGGHGCIDP